MNTLEALACYIVSIPSIGMDGVKPGKVFALTPFYLNPTPLIKNHPRAMEGYCYNVKTMTLPRRIWFVCIIRNVFFMSYDIIIILKYEP